MKLMTACFRPIAGKAIPKTLLIMKLVSIFMLAICLQAGARGFSQTVTLSEKNITLQKLLKKINRQSGFQFFYKDALLNKAGKINIQVKDAPLEQVLEICFKNLPVTYSVVEKTIVVKEKAALVTQENVSKPAFAQVTGIVKDERGDPLAGVSIVVKGTSKGTSTNEKGEFTIDANEGDALELSIIGYKTKIITVGKTTHLTIGMEIDIAEEKDIVVVGYGVQRKVSTTSAVSQVKSEDLVRRPVLRL